MPSAQTFNLNLSQTQMKMGMLLLAYVAATLAMMLPQLVNAGTGVASTTYTGDAAAFESVWETLVAWTQGTLGRIAAVSIVVVGVISGIARQSLMSFAIGIGAGMGLYNAPDIIDLIFGATLEAANTVTPALITISNGLGA